MRYITICLVVVWFCVFSFAAENFDCECRFNEELSLNELLCANKSLSAVPNLLYFNCAFKKVDLSQNKLFVVSNGTFSKTPELTMLYLNSNDIATIEVGTFSSLEHLEIIDLSNNALQYIDPDMFLNNTQLHTVILSNNPRMNTSKTTSILNAPSVKTLYLNRCMLRTINQHMFANLKHLKHLDLSSNDLELIPSNTFTEMHSLKHVEISDNLWKCDCKFQRLQDFVLSLMEDTPTSNTSLQIESVKCFLEIDNGVKTWSESLERLQCNEESNETYCISKECGDNKDIPTNDDKITGEMNCIDGEDGCTPKDCLTIIKYGTPYAILIGGGLMVLTTTLLFCIVKCCKNKHCCVSKRDHACYDRNIRVVEEGNRKINKTSSIARLISVNSDPGNFNQSSPPVICKDDLIGVVFSFPGRTVSG